MIAIIKFLTLVGTVVLYKYVLVNISFGGSADNSTQAVYIFRDMVNIALMFMIVPEVMVKVWSKK